MAIIQSVYYRHILEDSHDRFKRFAKVVFGVDTAKEGLDALETFIQECGLPSKLSQLQSRVEITPSLLRNICNLWRRGMAILFIKQKNRKKLQYK